MLYVNAGHNDGEKQSISLILDCKHSIRIYIHKKCWNLAFELFRLSSSFIGSSKGTINFPCPLLYQHGCNSITQAIRLGENIKPVLVILLLTGHCTLRQGYN